MKLVRGILIALPVAVVLWFGIAYGLLALVTDLAKALDQ